MKSSRSKILSFMMIIIILGALQFINADIFDEVKTFSSSLFSTQLYNPNVVVYEDLGVPGEAEQPDGNRLPTDVGDKSSNPVTLYTKERTKVYSSKSTNGNAVFEIEGCSEIKVYAVEKVSGWGNFGNNNNVWYKVSDIADLYVKYSEGYLSTTQPESCTTVAQTTRPTPTFDVSTELSPELGYDAMYANKKGVISVLVSNIKYLKADEYSNFNTKITLNGVDVDDTFQTDQIAPDSSGNVTFLIHMKEGTEYQKGTYNVEVWYSDTLFSKIVKNTSFEIKDKYYNFNATLSGATEVPYNIQNEWGINIIDDENINITDIETKFYKVTSGFGGETTTQDNSTFTSEIDSENKRIIISNVSGLKQNSMGKYRIIISYKDKHGNDSRSNPITYSFNIEFIKPSFTSKQETTIMHRYRYTSEPEPKEADIFKISKDRSFDFMYVEYTEDGVKQKKTLKQFTSMYSSAVISDTAFDTEDTGNTLYYDDQGRILYKLDSTTFLYNFNENSSTVSYYEISGNNHTPHTNVALSTFSKTSEDLEGEMELKSYEVDSSGNFIYDYSGLKTNKNLYDLENESVLATTGGEVIINVSLDNVPQNSLQNAEIKIYDEENENVTQWPIFSNIKLNITKTVEKEVTTQGFFNRGKKKNVYATEAQLTLLYDGQDDDFAGEYRAEVTFDGMSFNLYFNILEGTIDYYTRAEADLTDGREGTIPSNSKTNWFIGIFLSDGTGKSIKRNDATFTFNIYDHRIDIDDEGNRYFYDQHNYNLNIESYTGSNITYTPMVDGEEEDKVTNESFAVFKDKYPQPAELIENGMIGSANNLITDDYVIFKSGDEENQHTIKVYNVSFVEDTGKQMVEIAVDNGQKTTVDIEDATNTYDGLAYFLNSCLTDEDGNIQKNNIVGTSREKVESGKEISDEFNITFNNFEGLNNELRAISITPKTEVNPGDYYVYIGYNNDFGVGDINDDADNAIFDWNDYPQFWEQNIHMAVITYDNPKYEVSMLPPKLHNDMNDKNELFDNVGGDATYSARFENTYDFDKTVTAHMYKCTDIECDEKEYKDWTDVTEDFDYTYDFDKVNDESIELENRVGYINADIKEENIEDGTYILELEYKREITSNQDGKTGKYSTAIATQKFVVSDSAVGAIPRFEDDDTVYNYYADTFKVIIDTQFLPVGSELIPVLSLENGETYRGTNLNDSVVDGNKRVINDTSGNPVINYEFSKESITDEPDEDENSGKYIYTFTLVPKALAAENYSLYFEFQKDDKTERSSELELKVLKSNPEIVMSPPEDDIVYFDDNGIEGLAKKTSIEEEKDSKYIHIEKNVSANFISLEELDDIEFFVGHWDGHEYADISSSSAQNKQALISVVWDEEYTENSVNGVIHIWLERSNVDLNASSEDYVVQAVFEGLTNNAIMTLPAIKDLFSWEVDEEGLVITGEYYGEQYTSNNEFYEDMKDVDLNVHLRTPYKTNINWDITNSNECYREYQGSGNSCDPKSSNFDRYFQEDNTTGTDGNLVLNYTLSDDNKLSKGLYFLVLYYQDEATDRYILPVNVEDKYIDITFDDYLIYSDSGDEVIEDALFQNKKGHIYLPVILTGLDPEDTKVEFTDINGKEITESKSIFYYDEGEYSEEALLDISYNPTQKQADAKKYRVVVSATGRENVNDYIEFTMNSTFFSFRLGAPSYYPDPLIPNDENGGKITYQVLTEGMESVDEIRKSLPNNTTITNSKGEDVTKKFNVTTQDASTDASRTGFNLVVSFTKDSALEPGRYTLTTHHTVDNYYLEQTSAFTIGEYDKSLKVDKIEVFSTTNDEKVHRNVDGTFRLHYTDEYDLTTGTKKIIIKDSSSNDKTNDFEIIYGTNYIDVVYKAEKKLEKGNYTVEISYTENGKTNTTKVTIQIAADFNTIVLNNLNSHPVNDNTMIYSDLDDQNYTFDANTSGVEVKEYELGVEILDSEGHDVTDLFKVIDKTTTVTPPTTTTTTTTTTTSTTSTTTTTSTTSAQNNINRNRNLRLADNSQLHKYEVDIEPFKAPVGKYTVRLYVLDEDGEKNYSNALSITIDDNYYYIRLLDTSSISQKINYNADKTSIYDRDGAHVVYDYDTNFQELESGMLGADEDNKGITVIVRQDEEDQKEFKEHEDETFEFDTEALESGNYTVDICINGVTYASRKMTVVDYVPVKGITLTVDNKSITSDRFDAQIGRSTMKITVDPANATEANNIEVSSNIPGTINGNKTTLLVSKEGTVNLTIKVGRYFQKVFTVTGKQLLSSSVFDIDHNAKTIFVKTRDKSNKQFTVSEFTKGVTGLASGYKITNTSNGTVSTAGTTLIGTGYKLVNGGTTYTFIVIGDVTGDGKISTIDVSWLFAYRRGKRSLNNYQIKAGSIRKSSSISTIDVSWLFAFTRNKRNTI